MSTVFITGDRQLSPIYPTQIAIELIKALGQGKTVVTGTLPGVEQVVREMLDKGEVAYTASEHPLADGKPNFPKYAELVLKHFDEVLVVHADPHSSSVVKAFLMGGSKVRLVTPADLLQ